MFDILFKCMIRIFLPKWMFLSFLTYSLTCHIIFELVLRSKQCITNIFPPFIILAYCNIMVLPIKVKSCFQINNWLLWSRMLFEGWSAHLSEIKALRIILIINRSLIDLISWALGLYRGIPGTQLFISGRLQLWWQIRNCVFLIIVAFFLLSFITLVLI